MVYESYGLSGFQSYRGCSRDLTGFDISSDSSVWSQDLTKTIFRESPFIEIVKLPDKNIKAPLVDDFRGLKI